MVFADDWERRQYNETTHTRVDTVSEAVAVARSAPAPMVKAPNEGPRKPRLSIVTGDESSDADAGTLAVTWSSARGDDASPAVRWWREDPPGVRTSDVVVTKATSYTYERDDLCGAPANASGYRDPGRIHRAALTGIDRATTRFVVYELIDSRGGLYPPAGEPRLRARVPPPAGAHLEDGIWKEKENKKDSSRPVSVAMFADMGRGTDDDSVTWNEYGSPAFNTSNALTNAAGNMDIDAAFLFGDVSYATGYQSVWDDYLEMISPWAAAVPFLVNPGNHEYDYTRDDWPKRTNTDGGDANPDYDVYGGADSGGECGVPTKRLLPMGISDTHGQTVSPPGTWITSIGPIALVSMNTEVDFRSGSIQWRWLNKALGGINRTETPWVLFAGHRPGLVDSDWGKSCLGVDPAGDDRAWTCGPKKVKSDEGNEGEDVRDASDVGVALEFQAHVWPLLVKHDVTAVFSGHNHVYQRHCAFDPGREGSGIDSHLDSIRNLGPGEDPDDQARAQYGKAGGCVSQPRKIEEQNDSADDSSDNSDDSSDTTTWWVYDAPTAPVSLVVGSAGAGFTKNSRFSLSKGTETCEFCEVVMYEFGYLRVTSVNVTHLKCEFIETQKSAGRGKVLDRFYITRNEEPGADMGKHPEHPDAEKLKGNWEMARGWEYVAGACAVVAFVAFFMLDVFVPKDTVMPYVALDSGGPAFGNGEDAALMDNEV